MRQTTKAIFLLGGLLAGCATAPSTGMPKAPEAHFDEAQQLYSKGKYEDAIAQWKKVRESYRSPELTMLAELKIADAYFEDKSYIEAAAAYEDFRKLHPKHEKAAYALYRMALSNFHQIEGIDTDQTPVKNATLLFEQVLKDYPDSEYAAEAKVKLASCKSRTTQYEVYIARFYYRTGKYKAAIKRIEEIFSRGERTDADDEALFYLGASYLRTGDREKAREAFNRLFRDFPQSRHLDAARAIVDKEY